MSGEERDGMEHASAPEEANEMEDWEPRHEAQLVFPVHILFLSLLLRRIGMKEIWPKGMALWRSAGRGQEQGKRHKKYRCSDAL